MSDLRERVARALYEIPVFGVSGVGFPAWDDVTPDIREHYLNMADAAIALVLEEAEDAVNTVGDHADGGAYLNAIRALKESNNE